MSKGDKNLHARTELANERMQLRWVMAFGTDEESEDAKARLEFLEWQDVFNREGVYNDD